MGKRSWLLVGLAVVSMVAVASAGVMRVPAPRAQAPVVPHAMIGPAAITMTIEGGQLPTGLASGQLLRVLRMRHQVRAAAGNGGLPTGRRQHDLVFVTLPTDALSPAWHRAMDGNNLFSKVTLQWQRNGVPFYAIVLTQARVGSLAMHPDEQAGQVDEIGFSYHRIEWQSLPNGDTEVDDWMIGG